MGLVELLDERRSVVVVIDLQGKLMEMAYRSRLVIEATKRLMHLADVFDIPLVLTEQYPKGLGETHPEVRSVFDGLATAKRFVEKTSFGCCGEPKFMAALDELLPGLAPEQRQVVVAGIEAQVCVVQTVIELRRMNYDVHVCWECVSGRGQEYRHHAIERMVQAGAVPTNHESVAFEWCRDKNHPRFKEMSNLLKDGQLT
jgi:nicotinamidase-related amidase